MHLKMSSVKWRPFCPGGDELKVLFEPGFWSAWREVGRWQWRKRKMRTLRWRQNEHDGVSNHRRHNCLLNRLFRPKISKLCVTGLCEGNSPVTSEFPTQRASNAENVSIWWRHHEYEACNPGYIIGTSTPTPYHLNQLVIRTIEIKYLEIVYNISHFVRRYFFTIFMLTLRLRQNDRHVADQITKCIISNANYVLIKCSFHYNDVIMSTMASQVTKLTIVYSTVYSRRRSKKTSKLRVTGLCAGNSPVTGEFPAQRTSTA